VLDISAGGVQVEVGTSLRPAADCELRVRLAEGEITVRAKVRRCRAWGFGLDESDRRVLLYRAGLQFFDLPPESLAKLRRYYETPEAQAESLAAAAVEPVPEITEGAIVDLPPALPQAPRRSGPVKIRINSEYVRRILQGTDKQ
jgi:hypothetical protein